MASHSSQAFIFDTDYVCTLKNTLTIFSIALACLRVYSVHVRVSRPIGLNLKTEFCFLGL